MTTISYTMHILRGDSVDTYSDGTGMAKGETAHVWQVLPNMNS